MCGHYDYSPRAPKILAKLLKKAEASVIQTIKAWCYCWFWLPLNYFYLVRIWIFISFSPVALIVITVHIPTVCLIDIQTCSLGNKKYRARHVRCLRVVFILWFIFMNRLEFWPENILSQMKSVILFSPSKWILGLYFYSFRPLWCTNQ